MTANAINRFEWLKAVNRADLLPRAKMVASALAVEFCNHETGQLNPSVSALSAATNSTADTVKRALKDLDEAGWLGRSSGRGRGKHSQYQLCSPGQIISITTAKKGAPMHQNKGGTDAPLSQQKGAHMREKGGTDAPSYIEQTNKQTQALVAKHRKTRFGSNAWDGLTMIPEKDRDSLYAWGRWLKDRGFPALRSLPIVLASSNGGADIFALPTKRPPENERDEQKAMTFFSDLIEGDAASIAAQ